jgi:UDP-N-acetylmuramoyl-tripeptide--D-alanyl-D-alanine ligase
VKPIWGEITAREINDAVAGQWVRGDPEAVLKGLSTDSRTVKPGELFWALEGERYDGHDFVKQAADRGVAGIVVNRDFVRSEVFESMRAEGLPPVVVAVSDTLKALGDLACWWRHRHSLRVVAVTGSAGKTTTKEMIGSILDQSQRTLRNPGNFNNLIGLPLSLLTAGPEHRMAVLEMGMNRRGEIGRLTEIADPDVGVITNVGHAHLEGLGDMRNVARAKAEMVEKVSAGAKVVINGDDSLLMETASRFRVDLVTFGFGPGNKVRATEIHSHGTGGVSFELHGEGGPWSVRLRVHGRHNVMNALAAAAAVFSLGGSAMHVMDGLAQFRGVKGRFTVIKLQNGATLVDDSYNANPDSLRAALNAVAELSKGERRVILGIGEMLELGAETEAAHMDAGRAAARMGAHRLLAMGPHASVMIASAVDAGMDRNQAEVVEDRSHMVTRIMQDLEAGDIVLIKGSRKVALDRVVEGLVRSAARERL